MNETEGSFKSPGDSGVEELRNDVESLRTSVTMALFFLFIFSFCVNVFLFRQATAMGAQAAQARLMVTSWAAGSPMQIQAADFWNKLAEFSKTHPDFVPIMNKYSKFINTSANAAPKAAAPVPAVKK